MRIAAAFIGHETNTFSMVPTDWDDFVAHGVYEGQELYRRRRGTNSEMGGFIAAAEEVDAELIPTIEAFATPSGLVTRRAFDRLISRFITLAGAHGPLDGILFGQHGAMVVEGYDDGEAEALRRVRAAFGSTIPIIGTLDLHANISQEMVDRTQALVTYDTYPHIDMFERGREAGLLLARTISGQVRPTTALRRLPLLTAVPSQYTGKEPMRGIMALAHRYEAQPGVLCITIAPCFPYADIPIVGFGITVTTDHDPLLAQTIANEIGEHVLALRDQFRLEVVPPEEAVARAMAAPAGPVVIADHGDNPGGGGPCDGTVLLAALIRADAQHAVMATIRDPAVVQQAIAAGVGSTITVRLGGKTDRCHGEPVELTARVNTITAGEFINTGPMGTGVNVRMGPTVVLAHRGLEIIVVTNPLQTRDLALLRSVGIEPTQRAIVAIKSNVHFRAAFEPIATAIIEADTPGLTAVNLHGFTFHRIPRPIHPFDPIA